MRFSIVTITYNHLAGLRQTGESVLSQTYSDYEWIIIDGASDDGTAEYLAHISADIISEPDQGIYDAMNKGLARAKGDYVLFLNAGDLLANETVLADIAACIEKEPHLPDFIYGDAYEMGEDGTSFYKPARAVNDLKWGMITHHQAMLYRRAAIGDRKYDLNYTIAADYKFTAQIIFASRHVLYMNTPICTFEPGGISQRQATQGRLQQYAIRTELSVTSPLVNNTIYYIQTVIFMFKTACPALYWMSRSRQKPAS